MKFGNRFVSFLLKLVFSLFSGVWLFMLAVMMIYGWREGDLALGAIVLVAGAFCGVLVLMYRILTDIATGELTNEGVYVRLFLLRRFYPWDSIRQAGVLWRMGRGMHYNDLVLLPNGTPKLPGMRFPQRTNRRKVVYLPAAPEIRAYIIAHYGLLDFDEQADPKGFSIVVD